MDMPSLQKFAPPAVILLVCFLAYSSQWLFHAIDPGPLRKGDAYLFNGFVACLLICYWRSCTTDPGRIPKEWDQTLRNGGENAASAAQRRWCRKCDSFKPPRAHHCKTCRRCIVKMDHHCVWTANCVSHITFPHFIRFLNYAVISMMYLEYFLFQRAAVLWQKKHLPSYLGPSIFQLIHLFILVVTNSLVLFALILLLGRTFWSMSLNMTTIESWEVDRHEALLRRARTLGGYLHAPDGSKLRIERQEFPWDIGICTNLCEMMGSVNPIAWFWPFARSLTVSSGLHFEHNGIDNPNMPWPPPDPDRMFRAPRQPISGDPFTQSMDVDDFRKRQQADFARYADADGEYVVRRKPFHARLEEMQQAAQNKDDVAVETDSDDSAEEEEDELPLISTKGDDAGEEGWRNKEGERLADFGVDEVTDFYDEDDLPLSEIMRRRKDKAT